MRHETLLQRESSLLVLIDVQEKLLPAMADPQAVLRKCIILAKAAALLEVPIIISEQYPQGLGTTHGELRSVIGNDTFSVEKKTFSAAAVPELIDAVTASRATQILIAGIETHICVAQTALDLLIRGYQVHVSADACASRTTANHENALRRLQTAGIIVTNAESAIFEMLEQAGGDVFKTISRMIK